MVGGVLAVPAALAAPTMAASEGKTWAYVLFFVVLAVWLVTCIGAFTFLTGKAEKRLPGWVNWLVLVVVAVLLVVWVFKRPTLMLILGVVCLGGYYAWHLVSMLSKPGEKIADALSPEIRRDEAAARAAGEVPDEGAAQSEAQKRGDALEHVLDHMEEEAGHEVPEAEE